MTQWVTRTMLQAVAPIGVTGAKVPPRSEQRGQAIDLPIAR
jgi:hypothetical protein